MRQAADARRRAQIAPEKAAYVRRSGRREAAAGGEQLMRGVHAREARALQQLLLRWQRDLHHARRSHTSCSRLRAAMPRPGQVNS
jgi:hypothetical protein